LKEEEGEGGLSTQNLTGFQTCKLVYHPLFPLDKGDLQIRLLWKCKATLLLCCCAVVVDIVGGKVELFPSQKKAYISSDLLDVAFVVG